MGRFLDSSLGRKFVMATTGLLLVFFSLAHLAGNLTLYADQDGSTFVQYAAKLHELGPFRYLAELGLVLLFGVHIAMAFRLTFGNQEARPQPYVVKRTFGESNVASRSMILTGTVVLGFLVIHLANFRFSEGVAAPQPEGLYPTVVSVLQNPLWAALYIFGSIALGLHLMHGFKSLFQSLGAHHPKINAAAKGLGIAIAVLVAVGFASFPLAALFGLFKGEPS